MSEPTAPTSAPAPVPAPSGPIVTIEKDYAWVKAHLLALVISLVLVVGTAAGAVYGIESLIAKHDLATEAKYSTVLAAQVQQTQAAQQALATTQQQLLVMVQQVSAQNAQIEKDKAQRSAQNAKQQKVDASLSAKDAAARLSEQTKATPGEVSATGDSVTLDLPITRRVVGDEDSLIKAQADAAGAEAELANETLLFNKSQEVVADQAKLIASLTAQNKDQVAACAVEVKTVKAQARKSKMGWFFKGVVVGFIGGLFAGHAVGI